MEVVDSHVSACATWPPALLFRDREEAKIPDVLHAKLIFLRKRHPLF
jgi:hypothetical protein